MTLNTELFHRIAEEIRNEDRFNMASFVDGIPHHVDQVDDDDYTEFYDGAACGTTMCVAGWANWLTRSDPTSIVVPEGVFTDMSNAAQQLGITMAQGERLFFPDRGSLWAQVADRFGWEIYEYGLAEWSEIKAVQAAEILDEIADGLIEL